MRNPRELERLAFGVHTVTAVAYGALLVCHGLGRPYNNARRNRFETAFHTVGLIWCAAAIGVDTLAALSHRRAAQEER